MALKNLYTDLSDTSGYPNHNNPSFNYGAGSPVFGGIFEQLGFEFNQGTAYDRPGMGFSSEPFIKPPFTNGFADVGIIINSTDRFERGGSFQNNFGRRQIDLDRITGFLSTERGQIFTDKQRVLQLMNPEIRRGGLFSVVNSNQRTYTTSNLLAQIAGPTGTHIKREGILPTAFQGYKDDIPEISSTNPNNRLIRLFEKHIEPGTTTDFQSQEDENGFGSGLLNFVGGLTDSISSGIDFVTETLGLTPTDPELDTFRGGPGSLFGIGSTVLYRYSDTNKGKIVRDIGGADSIELPHEPFNTKKQTKKYTKNISEYHVSVEQGSIDALNQQDILENRSQYDDIEDFIPFRFEAVNTLSPNQSDFIVFKAFLESFTDNFNASHNEFSYNGRAERFYTYDNFRRDVNVSFKIAAQTQNEMRPLYKKLNYLIANTAPEYSSTGRIRTPFIKLTVGDWCNEVPGILNSVGLTWQKDYVWDVQNSNLSGLILPHVLDVSVQFTPIHKFLPEKSINTPFLNVNA